MALDLTQHPCFNSDVRHTTGRIHLPVAPKCNIQCNYCDRKFDCMNESRPGVTSAVLEPKQALAYLDKVLERVPQLKVVGIAGPGDPFASPDETLETLRLVREKYPEMLLCVASNGLNVAPYAEELAQAAGEPRDDHGEHRRSGRSARRSTHGFAITRRFTAARPRRGFCWSASLHRSRR